MEINAFCDWNGEDYKNINTLSISFQLPHIQNVGKNRLETSALNKLGLLI